MMKTKTKTAPKKAKVLIVDDHPIVRHGMAQLINRQRDLCVCGEADSVNGALRIVAALNPDVVIADISLKGQDGLGLIKELKIRHPQIRILVVSIHDERIYAERALKAGAHGYVMKQ